MFMVIFIVATRNSFIFIELSIYFQNFNFEGNFKIIFFQKSVQNYFSLALRAQRRIIFVKKKIFELFGSFYTLFTIKILCFLFPYYFFLLLLESQCHVRKESSMNPPKGKEKHFALVVHCLNATSKLRLTQPFRTSFGLCLSTL